MKRFHPKKRRLRTYQFMKTTSFRGRVALTRPSQWTPSWMSNVGIGQEARIKEASRISGFQVILNPAYDIKGRRLDKSIAVHALHGGANATEFWEVYHDLPSVIKNPEKFKCQCPDIYEQGCKCGGE